MGRPSSVDFLGLVSDCACLRTWKIGESWFLRLVKQRFAQWYNKRQARTGALWEDRFKSVLVEGAGPALSAMAVYIDLNPVRAGIVEDPADYRWCGNAEAVAGLNSAIRVRCHILTSSRKGTKLVSAIRFRC